HSVSTIPLVLPLGCGLIALRLSRKSSGTTMGDSARFDCDVDGEPAPSITWLREGSVVGSSARHHVVSTQYNSSFEISSVEQSDEGSYTLLVENAGGKQEAYFTLKIRKSESKDKVVAPPRITSPEAKSPAPKTPEPITSPQRVKSPEPITSPQRVKSPVSPKSPTPKSPTPKSPTPKSPTPSETKRVMSPPPDKKSEAPRFLVQPRSQIVDEGQKVTFTCEVSGEPFPEVEWLKDDVYQSGFARMVIREAFAEDSGRFTCTATNEAGTVSTSCYLLVKGNRWRARETHIARGKGSIPMSFTLFQYSNSRCSH
uniref:Ig-like domain-containing protein n=1 Tax=Salarias fasciatus TaxID=181472 RepID=A0A672I814_SALFA